MSFFSFLKWTALKRIRKIRPLWYIKYSKKEAREFLKTHFDWQYYNGHHFENRLSTFLHTIYNPQKFNIDNRNWSLAAEARNGLISREEALRIYQTPIEADDDLLNYFNKRLGLTKKEFEEIMKKELKNYKQYSTYKRRFERLRPLFYLLAKSNLVPMSFYIKYTSKTEGA